MKLSIIIPVYNVQKFIGHTIESIMNQNCPDFELIIVNDGSTDDSLNLIQLTLSKYDTENVRVFSQKNQGVSVARNVGMYNSIGKYLYFLDGDDFVSNGMINQVIQLASDDSPDILYWAYDLVDSDYNTIKKYQFKNSVSTIDSGVNTLSCLAKKSASIWIGSAIYRRDLLEANNIRFTPNCISGEDTEFIHKALIHAKNVLFSKMTLSFYVKRVGSVTNQYNIRRFDAVIAKDRVCRYFDELGMLPENISDEYKGYILSHYMVVYKSCLQALISKDNLRLKEAIIRLSADITQHYPYLKEILKPYLKYVYVFNLKKRIKINLFLFSPSIYYYLFNTKTI